MERAPPGSLEGALKAAVPGAGNALATRLWLAHGTASPLRDRSRGPAPRARSNGTVSRRASELSVRASSRAPPDGAAFCPARWRRETGSAPQVPRASPALGGPTPACPRGAKTAVPDEISRTRLPSAGGRRETRSPQTRGRPAAMRELHPLRCGVAKGPPGPLANLPRPEMAAGTRPSRD